jgi:hypothetical protein
MINPALFVDCYYKKTWAQRDLAKNSFESKEYKLENLVSGLKQRQRHQERSRALEDAAPKLTTHE